MNIVNNNKAITLKARDQLVQGREAATTLQQLLFQHGSGLDPEDDLVAKILESFNNSISTLDSKEPVSSSSLVTAVEGSQNASCDNDGKLEDSGDSRKRLGPVKGKRGCYKRKKRSETWTVESTVLEDTFSWRKYGQKEILNAKFPRSYFRCTHKFTQGCKATKQVQKLELESKMFNITYIGNHTCNTKEVAPNIKPCVHHDEIIIDSEELKSPSLMTTMKEEEENHHHHHGSSTESDLQLVWQEILVCEEEHLHHHEAIYGCGETSVNGLDSTDLWSWQQ
ncbi:hypothetical protein N665_0201s0340 [Sinapis alba]|nr:hypothetical protein N665_0201s0340 [Sinapis alba]